MHAEPGPLPLPYWRTALRHIVSCLLLGVSTFLSFATAGAQTPLANREPGLWELRLVDGSSLASIALGVQRAFRNLPEAQRRQMEQLIGSSGLELPTVVRQCLTPELARRDLRTVLADHHIECSELDWQEAGGSGRFSFVCTNPDGDWTGQGRITDATRRSFNSEATVQGKYRGQPVSLDMKHEARWLGAECGDVKPPR